MFFVPVDSDSHRVAKNYNNLFKEMFLFIEFVDLSSSSVTGNFKFLRKA